MLKTGILNPQINSLLSRVRHTNTLVIADRGFPFGQMIETVDISLGAPRPSESSLTPPGPSSGGSGDGGWPPEATSTSPTPRATAF